MRGLNVRMDHGCGDFNAGMMSGVLATRSGSDSIYNCDVRLREARENGLIAGKCGALRSISLKIFECSNRAPAAIWNGGFTAASKKLAKIVAWLDGDESAL